MNQTARKLEQLRRVGETKKQFALRLGISPVQLSRYLRGVTPGREVLARISEATGASLDWLLAEGEPEVRRVGLKTTRRLKNHELIALACTYLDDLEGFSREERQLLKEIVTELANDRERLLAISRYLRFLHVEEKRGH